MTTDYLPLERFARWLAYGERGASSNSIFRAATDGPRDRWGWMEPADPSDFRRCELLLAEVPEAREVAFPRLAAESRAWAALIERWDDIVALLDEEVPDRLTAPSGQAPRAYRLMLQARKSAWKDPS